MRWGEQDGVTFSYTFSSANRACREQRVQDVAMLVSYRHEVLADAEEGQEYFNYIRLDYILHLILTFNSVCI